MGCAHLLIFDVLLLPIEWLCACARAICDGDPPAADAAPPPEAAPTPAANPDPPLLPAVRARGVRSGVFLMASSNDGLLLFTISLCITHTHTAAQHSAARIRIRIHASCQFRK